MQITLIDSNQTIETEEETLESQLEQVSFAPPIPLIYNLTYNITQAQFREYQLGKNIDYVVCSFPFEGNGTIVIADVKKEELVAIIEG